MKIKIDKQTFSDLTELKETKEIDSWPLDFGFRGSCWIVPFQGKMWRSDAVYDYHGCLEEDEFELEEVEPVEITTIVWKAKE